MKSFQWNCLRQSVVIPRSFSDAALIKSPATLVFIFVLLLFGGFVTICLVNVSFSGEDQTPVSTLVSKTDKVQKVSVKKIEIPLNCTAGNSTKTCPYTYYPLGFSINKDNLDHSPSMCPDYFRWIYEDLRPWKESGITQDMVESARRTASFRLIIVSGRAYVEKFKGAFQSRDVFTLWGILQLLRKYPGKVPDLELMFDCVDWPVILSKNYGGPNATSPPPLFRYCGDDDTFDIVFPDWSFWGWPEIRIKPWELLLKDLNEGNKQTKWIDREPYAFWKGNPFVADTRLDLLKCNGSGKDDWSAHIFIQDWIKEAKEGYKKSDMANQCNHRYKIYIEGSAWSVSQKYILACDSVTLLIDPHYYDFFTRGLIPLRHYWPINTHDKCRSIKYAVQWGNKNTKKAREIGKAGSRFIHEELRMDFVYDYMLHLLTEYAKLLRFNPVVPKTAVEVCSEIMGCPAEGVEKKFKIESLVSGPAEMGPCHMPDRSDHDSLVKLRESKEKGRKQVGMWEHKYWHNNTTAAT